MKKHAFVCAVLGLLLSAPAFAGPRHDILPGPVFGEVIDVLDGDTVNVRLHVWIGQNIETHVRIAGIDTPELKGKCANERALAKQARDEVAALFQDGKISLYNIKLEKYAGRVLADAKTADGISLADHMIRKGLARAYRGEKRAGWCGG